MQRQSPPLVPSDEATGEELALAHEQGQVMRKALKHMLENVADDGREKQVGDYLVAYAVEKAEGMYISQKNDLSWHEAEEANLHLEISVRDAADGRFIPGLQVWATLIDDQGRTAGSNIQPFIWHPWLYHYGRNWQVPDEGPYTLHVRVEPADFPRHDKTNGKLFGEPVEVEFQDIRLELGQK
jgi:hypothetical protein